MGLHYSKDASLARENKKKRWPYGKKRTNVVQKLSNPSEKPSNLRRCSGMNGDKSNVFKEVKWCPGAELINRS